MRELLGADVYIAFVPSLSLACWPIVPAHIYRPHRGALPGYKIILHGHVRVESVETSIPHAGAGHLLRISEGRSGALIENIRFLYFSTRADQASPSLQALLNQVIIGKLIRWPVPSFSWGCGHGLPDASFPRKNNS